MSQEVVKILRNEDGQIEESPKWHLAVQQGGVSMAACTGEVFGFASACAEYESKDVSRGGITCPGCLELVRWYKAVKL